LWIKIGWLDFIVICLGLIPVVCLDTLDAGQSAEFTHEDTFGGTLPLVFNYSDLDQMPRVPYPEAHTYPTT